MVRIKGSLSNWLQAESRVPQGSVLTPALFLIFVSYLPMIHISRKIWINLENGIGNGFIRSININVVIHLERKNEGYGYRMAAAVPETIEEEKNVSACYP